MGYTFKFISPAGREWRLMDRNPNGVFIREGALESAFMGSFQESSSTAVGRAGQTVSSQDSQFSPISDTLQCVVSEAYCGGRSVEEVWREFRDDWESTTPEKPGWLVLGRPDGEGAFHLPARLGGKLPGALINPSEMDEIPVSIPVIADQGQWLLPLSDDGVVTVTNGGKGLIYPKIWWQGAGGVVTLPSGVKITLPPVTQPRILNLDYASSFEVLDNEGVIDDALWRSMRGSIVGEGVPIGSSRTYALPSGAMLHWSLIYLNPWR